MDSLIEKRTSKRKTCKVFVSCSFLNRDPNHTATVIDFCSDGLRLISDAHYTPGTPISIHISNWQQDIPTRKDEVCLHTHVTGEVKWCAEITSAAGSRYQLGVKYFSTFF